MIFSSNFLSGKYIASQSDDKSVRVWKIDDWKQETVVTEPFEEVRTMIKRNINTIRLIF